MVVLVGKCYRLEGLGIGLLDFDRYLGPYSKPFQRESIPNGFAQSLSRSFQETLGKP